MILRCKSLRVFLICGFLAVGLHGCGGDQRQPTNRPDIKVAGGLKHQRVRKTSLTGKVEVIGKDTRGNPKVFRMLTDDGWEVWLEGSNAQRVLLNFIGRRVKVSGELGTNELGGYRMMVHQATNPD
jgi:hypothetical protein